jgi:hypothetical protein
MVEVTLDQQQIGDEQQPQHHCANNQARAYEACAEGTR